MKPSAFQNRIEHQFDSMCKKVIKHQQKNYLRDIRNLSKKEVSLSLIDDKVLNNLYFNDNKPSDYHVFIVKGGPVNVQNDSLGEALKELPHRKREIILLHYFLEMSDIDIAYYLNLNRSTVYRHRLDALTTIKKLLEGGSI